MLPVRVIKPHSFSIDDIIIEKGAVNRVAEIVGRYDAKKVFLLADRNTYEAAGKQICENLLAAGFAISKHVFGSGELEPDEHTVGSAVMGFDPACDLILAVGSGVINDVGKILANVSGKPYIIFGTAPSMDGYAFATSSMSVGGLKVSLPSKQVNVIMTDTEILAKAPTVLLQAGIGDMLAKYVAICEWKIAQTFSRCIMTAKIMRQISSDLRIRYSSEACSCLTNE